MIAAAPPPAAPQEAWVHYLSACLIFRDEASYLAEWLAFYRAIGVEHFYLYNNNSTDDVHAAIGASGVPARQISLGAWPRHPGQVPAYNHCLREFGRESRWIAFVDIDEFLFSPVVDDLRRLLTDYERYGALCAHWLQFGASGHERRPAGLVTRNYRWRNHLKLTNMTPGLLKAPELDRQERASYWPHSAHVKAIVAPTRVEACKGPHRFTFRDDYFAVNEREQRIDGNWSEPVCIDRVRINHYWTRSIEELERKLERGRADTGLSYSRQMSRRLEAHCNDVLDETIQPLLERIGGMFECDFIRPPQPYLHRLILDGART